MSDNEVKKTPRQYPNNFEAEQYVLCCFLIDGTVVQDHVKDVNEDYFYSPRHKAICRAIMQLADKGSVVNVVTVNDRLSKDKSGDINTLEYLTELAEITPGAVNITDYIRILERDMIMRKLIEIGNSITEDAYSSDVASASVTRAEQMIYSLSNKTNSKGQLEHIADASRRFLARLELLASNPDALKGLETGYPRLDRVTNGLQPNSLIILAARPSVGKTAFVLNIIANIIRQKKDKVIAMFSLEMPSEQLVQRILATNTDVGMHEYSTGQIDEESMQEVWSAHTELGASKVFVESVSMQTPGNIASRCRQLKAGEGGGRLDLVVIDYLQLMANDKDKERRSSTRQTDVSDISRMLKIMAMELECPVIALSQMSRSIEGRTGDDKQPRLSDLRESGAIEQDADMVMFLSRENDAEKIRESSNIILDIAKHRNGELKKIRYVFEGPHVRFTESDDQSFSTFTQQ